jgi:hypothetical protein
LSENILVKFSQRLQTWLKVAERHLVEIALGISGFLGIVGKFSTLGIQGSLAITIFLSSIIYSIFRIRTSVEKVDELSSRINALLLEHAAQYPEQYLRLIFKGVEQSREPHVRAGHELVTEVYKYAADLVTDLKRHRESKDRVQIIERFVINDFLKGVVNALPDSSYWLGITRLTSAWSEQPDPGFRDLVDAMNSRAAKGELTVLRIYCAESEELLRPLEPHLSEAARSGIEIRTLTKKETKGKELPSDLSLLWGATNAAPDLSGDARPADRLTKMETAICGMEFETREGRSLDTLTICGPESPDFRRLRFEFDDSWADAVSYKR